MIFHNPILEGTEFWPITGLPTNGSEVNSGTTRDEKKSNLAGSTQKLRNQRFEFGTANYAKHIHAYIYIYIYISYIYIYIIHIYISSISYISYIYILSVPEL